jgi:Zn-dependent peptidase ImmA (M78 family)
MALERGYKAWTERAALALRQELKLEAEGALPASLLAKHLGIELITPVQLEGLPAEISKPLVIDHPDGWSAVSYEGINGTTIIYNGQNSPGRQSSDIMHEIAHVLRGHEPSQLILSAEGDVAMRSYDSKQEDEANWLGWTILLPRPALVRCMDMGLTNSAIATEYNVSEQLVEFRLRMTGIRKRSSRIRVNG